jgi:hypothetical protein
MRADFRGAGVSPAIFPAFARCKSTGETPAPPDLAPRFQFLLQLQNSEFMMQIPD